MMIKDTFFSMPRFLNLCRKEMVENWKANVLRIVLMYGVMAIALLWKGYYSYRFQMEFVDSDPMWHFGLTLFIICLLGYGCLSASFTMENMKTKTSRLSVLMTPATPFEQFFSRWVVYTFAFLVIFLIVFLMADYTRVLVYSLKYPYLEGIAPVSFSYFIGIHAGSTIFHTTSEFSLALLFYFFFQSCFVLGSSIFAKNAFLKTFVAGAIVAVVYVLVAAGLIDFLAHKKLSFVVVSQETIYAVLRVLTCSFALLNWTLAYFRFKESEIITRM